MLSSRSLEEDSVSRGLPPNDVVVTGFAGVMVDEYVSGFDCDASANMFIAGFWALDAVDALDTDGAVSVTCVVAGDCGFTPKLKGFVLGAENADAGALSPPKLKVEFEAGDCTGEASAESGFMKLKDGLEAGACEIAEAGLVAPKLKVGLVDGVWEGDASVVLVLPKLKEGLDWDGVCEGDASVVLVLPKLKEGLSCIWADVGAAAPNFGIPCVVEALERFANVLPAAGVAPLEFGVSWFEGVRDRVANGLLGDWGAVVVVGVEDATIAGSDDCLRLAPEQCKYFHHLPVAVQHCPLHAP